MAHTVVGPPRWRTSSILANFRWSRRAARLREDDEAAGALAGPHLAERVGDLIEREPGGDHGREVQGAGPVVLDEVADVGRRITVAVDRPVQGAGEMRDLQ